MRKKWIIIIIVVILIAMAIGFSRCNKAKNKKPVSAVQEHEKYTVKRGKIDSKIEVTGEVQPATIVSQKSRVSGKIVKFYVKENDYVKMGQILADIEPDYNQANTLFNTKASLQRAELELQKAQKDFADSGTLLGNEYISQADYDKARDALVSAEIQHAQASRQYEMI
ncbi:MAG: biotin/lipoyl-binding protein, partial [Candidatus Cloacimonetes bacterium]|nr:biotin/lipoyl-binding protein [Candidatus Cloacimonadota bacterium]